MLRCFGRWALRISAARDAGSQVYRRVAEIHAGNIDQGFLSTLGVGVLTQLYRAIDESQGGALFVATDGGRIAGFVSGGVGMSRIYRRMLAHWLALVPALLPALLRPSVLRGLFELLRHAVRKQDGGADLPRAELLSLAVAPEYRGQGVAEALYQALCGRFAADGYGAFRIVVGEALAPAHRFYQKMGARAETKVEVHRGRESVIYVQSIAAPQAGET